MPTKENTITNRQQKLLSFVKDFQALRQGATPSRAQLALHMGCSTSTIRDILAECEKAGIARRDGPRDIVFLNGQRPPKPESEAPPEPPRPAYAPPDGMTIPTDYEPPRELLAARRDARLYASAARMHMAEIERLEKDNNRLRQYARGSGAQIIRRLEQENERLTAENTRLQSELKHATAAWRRYQNEARSVKELYNYGKWAAQKIASLAGEAPRDPCAGLVQ